jgi:hypothetical protein
MNIVKWYFYVWTQWASLIHIQGCRGDLNQYTPCREITWQHDTREPRRQHEWPPFVMSIKESGRVGSYFTIVLSSTRYLNGHPWVAQTLSHYTSMKWGKISSNSATVEATKFAGPDKSRMRQYIINAYCNMDQPTWSLIDTGGSHHLRAPNLTSEHSQSSHLVFSTFS